MLKKVVTEDFLITPIKKYKGNLAPVLSDGELLDLINQIETYLNAASLSELEQSNTLYWLTHGLSNAMKNKNFSAAYRIASILYRISEKHPHVAMTMLGKKIEFGEFKDQTGVFVWMDRFYAATFDSIFSPTLIAINLIFSNLLEHDESKALCLTLAKPTQSGFTSGTNALLNLVYALKNAADYDCNQSTTSLIAELLEKFISKSPDVLGLALTQEITKGVLSGASYINLIAAILARASKDNIDAVKTICNMLSTVNEKHARPLMISLTKISESGYNKGMNPFHILLTTLVSAAYVKDNTEMVNIFVALIHDFFKKSPDQISAAFTQPIQIGQRKGENGIMHLVHTLLIAMERNINTTKMTHLLLEIIEHNDNALADAFNSTASNHNNHYVNTPLFKLESKLNSQQTTPTQKEELECIINKLNKVINNSGFTHSA